MASQIFEARDFAKRISVLLITAAVVCSCNSNNSKKESSSKAAASELVADQSVKKAGINDPSIAGKAVDSNWLLIPGASAGNIPLDENADSVMAAFGKPDGGDAAMGKAIAVWYTGRDTTAHSVSIYTSRDMGENPVALIKQIRVNSPSFKTKEGIGPSSPLPEIQKTFNIKKAESYRNAGQLYTVYDDLSGIAFEVNSNGICTAVIIHEKGQPQSGTYLKFRTTGKN